MNAPIDITAHFSMNIASASKRVLSSLLLPPLFRAASFSGDAGSRDSSPHGYDFRHRATETWIFFWKLYYFPFRNLLDWTNIDASFDLIIMLFVSIFINSIDGNWDEKKDFPGR